MNEVAVRHFEGKNITVKQLFKSLPHSTTAIRYHYSRFINDGWIEAYSNVQDKRVKFVRPTQKFIVVLTLYSSTAGMFKLPIVSP